MARIAKSLAVLRDQVNARWPNRSKLSDGWIGDQAHAARTSDHNPNAAGVVTALDITHDTDHGVDTWKLAESLRQLKDPRIKYVISNGRIFSSVVSPWQWRPYTGENKHAHHVHVSVMADPSLYDLESPWRFDASDPAPRPVVKPPSGITADMRKRMAREIVNYEARRVDGRLAVYYPPLNDGGGAYEVAGINVKNHPDTAARLRSLIESGKATQAEAEAADFVLDYTKPATGWTTDAGVEFYLRDCIFNRGPTGAARILQLSVGVPDDGQVGPSTRGAMSRVPDLLASLRIARERYEREVVGYRENLWRGLQNRWDKALVKAREFQKEQGSKPVEVIRDSTGAGTLMGLVLAWLGANPWVIALAVALTVGAVIYFKRRK